LLGSGESGKSTFWKQIKTIHSEEYSDEELLQYKNAIYANVIQTMKILSQICLKKKKNRFKNQRK